MKVIISDANVIIDMVDCGLIDNVFELPYQFTVPDMQELMLVTKTIFINS